jgi:dethiobiotin synthetase
MRIFITGIGTGVGKTLVSAIVTEALEADYWKPVQAGLEEPDAQWIREHISNDVSVIHDSEYALKLPASPHIAAREENTRIDLPRIINNVPSSSNHLVIEGAGGLLVPLNEKEFIADLALQLDTKVILVSRNYLGSINHSLLTAEVCRQKKLNVLGWIFNDQYMQYEEEIVGWSGIPQISSIPLAEHVTKEFVVQQASLLKDQLKRLI